MALILLVSLLTSLLYCSVHAGVTYQVAHTPAKNMHSGAHHPDKAAITVAQAGDNYAFSVLNNGLHSKVIQQQAAGATASAGPASAAAGPAVVQSTHPVVAHAPATTFVGAYGAPVVHQPVFAQPIAIIHQSPTLVHQVVDGSRHVFRAVPVVHHPVMVEPVIRHVPVPIPYAAAAHHPQLVHAGHVVPTGHVISAPSHGVVPHSAPNVFLAHHKK